MRNIKLTIEYDGTAYCGWQVQNGHSSASSLAHKKTIQEVIERSLKKILREKVRLVSSGRTDAGVHAFMQVANFKTASGMPLDKLRKGLNAVLPKDIAVNKAAEANEDFHSRFAARSKTYRYLILNRPHRSALLKGRAYFYAGPLNIGLMRQEAKALIGRHNFKAFCASGSSAKDFVRTVNSIRLKKLGYAVAFGGRSAGGSPLLAIDIEASGFLYNMVRNICGTLLEIGRGRFPKGSMKRILKSEDRGSAGPTLPAYGLYLERVRY